MTKRVPPSAGLRILLVDDDPARLTLLRQGLAQAGYELAGQVGPKDDLLAALRRTQSDVVIASVSSPGRDTLEGLAKATASNPKPVVMFVGEEGADLAGEAIRAGVSAYVVDGLAPKRVKSVLDVAIARFAEFQKLREEVERSRTALAERKVIERAKGILMRQRGIDEDEAYQMLRRAAMAQNRRLVDVAESLIGAAQMLSREP
jgi:response regulator NasT